MNISPNLQPTAVQIRLPVTAPTADPQAGESDTGDIAKSGPPQGEGSRALSIFRQELHAVFKMSFDVRFSYSSTNYAQEGGQATADDVADDTLRIASGMAAESPSTASKTLTAFRAKVHQSAEFVRKTVGDDHDLDKAVAKVDAGLAELDDGVSANRESSASVLEVDTRVKQRSNIRIRTQEGDVVKLSLRRHDRFSATSSVESNAEATQSSTEISLSSKSRIALQVDGDLNDAELEAIKNILIQAENVANSIFDGDLGAALAGMEGLEIDDDQIARVKMRFRMQQQSEVSYRETVQSQPAVVDAAPAADLTPAPGATQEPLAAAIPVDSDAAAPVEKSPGEEPVITPPPQPADEAAANVILPSTFFEAISSFLRAVSEGFSGSGEPSFRLHHSTSMKLDLLKAVINTSATEPMLGAAETLQSAIGQTAIALESSSDRD